MFIHYIYVFKKQFLYNSICQELFWLINPHNKLILILQVQTTTIEYKKVLNGWFNV